MFPRTTYSFGEFVEKVEKLQGNITFIGSRDSDGDIPYSTAAGLSRINRLRITAKDETGRRVSLLSHNHMFPGLTSTGNSIKTSLQIWEVLGKLQELFPEAKFFYTDRCGTIRPITT